MNLKYPTHAESAFYANPSPQDHFLNPYDPSYSYMPPVLCDYCESPYHDASTCPYREYVDATCASFEKKLNDMTNQMIETMKLRFAEYSQCFVQNRETSSEIDSSLGSPKPDIDLCDVFEPSYSTRPDLNENMCLPSLEQESDLPKSLSSDLAPCTSSLENVTNEQSDSDSELEISTIPALEFHDLGDSKDVSQELHDEIPELTMFDFDDNILPVEYESFSGEFGIHGSSDDGFHADYESFSFNSIQSDFLFESSKSESVESEMITTDDFTLDQTHMHIELKGLVDLEPFALPRQFIHGNIVSRPMTSLLAYSEYVHFIPEWAQLLISLNGPLPVLSWLYGCTQSGANSLFSIVAILLRVGLLCLISCCVL